MTGCGLYDDPALYDRLFPEASKLSPAVEEERRRRILLSEQFYVEEARQAAGNVLELGCGSGRLTIPIARQGIDIVGLDSSASMLAAAREKAAGCRVPPRFIAGDMRRFDLPERFALILIAGNSLLHMLTPEDLGQCLACARRHMAPGGRLIFDVSNPNLALLALPPGGRRPVITYHDAGCGDVRVEESPSYDAATQVNRATWYFSSATAPDYRVIEFRLRMIFPQEIPPLLEAAGLRLEQRYGEFTREPFEPGSPRQVCICRAF